MSEMGSHINMFWQFEKAKSGFNEGSGLWKTLARKYSTRISKIKCISIKAYNQVHLAYLFQCVMICDALIIILYAI